MLGRNILVLCSYRSYCGQEILRVVHRHSGDSMFPPVVSPWVTSEASKVSGEALDSQVGMLSGLPLVHPHLVSVVEPGGMSTAPASVRNRLSPTRKEKLLV